MFPGWGGCALKGGPGAAPNGMPLGPGGNGSKLAMGNPASRCSSSTSPTLPFVQLTRVTSVQGLTVTSSARAEGKGGSEDACWLPGSWYSA